MNDNLKFLTLTQLNKTQIQQYRDAVASAFPTIIQQSKVIENNWSDLERFFPSYQIFAIDKADNLIGLMNMVPIHWDQPLADLPDEGWDWLLKTGIQNHKESIKPNTIGGLQVIIPHRHRSKGYSKLLIQQAKTFLDNTTYKHLIIPIRPTLKHNYPHVGMDTYINMKEGNKILDPWIRTHIRCGAQVVKVCTKSMHVTGDISFWQQLTKSTIKTSGKILIEGALNPIQINLPKNQGVYWEENIWIHY